MKEGEAHSTQRRTGTVGLLRFAGVELRPAERRLLAGGKPLPLGSRAYDLLLALIDRRDRVVPKNELLDIVWPQVFVEEGNLKAQVSALRKTLGEDVIATVPGRGYRFTARLDADDLAAAAPPPAAPVAAAPHPEDRLPRPPAPLIGRDADEAALTAALTAGRLVTVAGAGGIGKTSLALAAARRHAQAAGVEAAWVELASFTDAALLPAAVAGALSLSLGAGPALDALLAALRPLRRLVVLDNAEHLAADVAALVQAVLRDAPEVTLLVTSQVPLKLPAERVYRLEALALPAPGASAEDAVHQGAVALFAERASAADRRFKVDASNVALVAQLCQALDGLPLAIELAASRLPMLGLSGLAARLEDRLRLLSRGSAAAPARQQTLAAALDWSHALLSPTEQRVFRRLAVFSGGFALGQALQVCRDESEDDWTVTDALESLVERSLVAADAHDPPRYRLLEGPRAYAAHRLEEAGDAMLAARQHVQAMNALSHAAAQALWQMPESTWLERHAPELDNLRAAIHWSVQHAPGLALGLAGRADSWFRCLTLPHEHRRLCEPLAPLLDQPGVAPIDRADFLLARAAQLRDVSLEQSHAAARAALEAFGIAGDARGRYRTLYELNALFHTFPDEAIAAAEEMTRLLDPEWPPALRALEQIAVSKARYAQQRFDENGAALRCALDLARRGGADRLVLLALNNLADHSLAMRRPAEAVEGYRELTAILRRTHRRSQLAFALANMACAQLMNGETVGARESLGAALPLMREADWTWLRGFGDVYALLAAQEGRTEAAALLLGWADDVRKSRGGRQVNEARCRATCEALLRARLDDASLHRLLGEGARMVEQAVAELCLAR